MLATLVLGEAVVRIGSGGRAALSGSPPSPEALATEGGDMDVNVDEVVGTGLVSSLEFVGVCNGDASDDILIPNDGPGVRLIPGVVAR